MTGGKMGYNRYSELGRSLGILGEDLPWYWNLVIYSSPWLLMAGFVMIPFAMDVKSSTLHANRSAVTVASFFLIGVSYFFCALSCFRWRKHDVLQDLILIPFFGSSVIGLLNVAVNLTVRQLYPLDALSVAVIAISCASVVGYGSAAVYNSKIENYIPGVLKKQKDSKANKVDDAELQRRQLLRLYLKKDGDRAPSMEASQSTFRINLPEARDFDREQELVVAPRKNAYERQLPPAPPPNEYNPFVMQYSPTTPCPSVSPASSSRKPSNSSWYGVHGARPVAELGDL